MDHYQVSALLWYANFIVHFIWSCRLDPDDVCTFTPITLTITPHCHVVAGCNPLRHVCGRPAGHDGPDAVLPRGPRMHAAARLTSADRTIGPVMGMHC